MSKHWLARSRLRSGISALVHRVHEKRLVDFAFVLRGLHVFIAYLVHIISCSGWSIPIAGILMRLQQAETNQSNLLSTLKL